MLSGREEAVACAAAAEKRRGATVGLEHAEDDDARRGAALDATPLAMVLMLVAIG